MRIFRLGASSAKWAAAAGIFITCSPTQPSLMSPKKANLKEDIVLVPGTGNKQLAFDIACALGITPAPLKLKRFSDGEVSCRIMESMRGKDVFIVQPCANPVNDMMMELLLMISCAKRCGANRVTAVVPYFGYKYHRRGEPISTENQSRFLWSASGDFSKMMNVMGVDRIISVDLHRPGQGQETCFFDASVPVETVSSSDAVVKALLSSVRLHENVTVVAANPDFIKKARKYQMGISGTDGVKNVAVAAFMRKCDGSEVRMSRDVVRLLGDVRDSDVIVVDDVVDTGASLSNICHALRQYGARKVYICASHGMFSANSMQLIRLSPVEKVFVTDSLPLPPDADAKVVQVSMASTLAKLIETEYFTSIMFRQEDEEVYENE
ncbi:prs [Symbiodinium microadriaticum]|nr:prs [Symbiodinium microadriaticum]